MANSYSGGYAPSSRARRGSSNPSVKLIGLIGLIGLGAAVVFARKPGDIVTGRSGAAYRVVLVSNTGGVKTYDIFGAATGTLLLRYTQTGSDTSSRKLVAVGQGVDQTMVRAAASDFAVPLPGGS